MRIIQITDLHLPSSHEDARGVDTWKNLDLILPLAESYQPDLLVFTGDICYDEPEQETYMRFSEHIKNIDVHMRFIAGNHDTAQAIKKLIKSREETDYYPLETYENCEILYLESSDAHLSEDEYALLKKLAHERDRKPLIIFMHHPPCEIGVPHMDENHAFAEAEKFKKILSDSSRPIHIFCGHYHNGRSIFKKDFTVHCTPSLFFQIDEKQKEFKILTYNIALRVIDIEDAAITTYVRHLERPSA